MSIHGLVRGTAWTGQIDLPQDDASENAVGEFVVRRTYRTLFLSWYAEAPLRGSAHPIYPKAKLETKSARQITPGFLCDVTITYRAPREDVIPENDQLPRPKFCEVVTEGTASIEEHPNFLAFATEANGAIWEPVPGNFVERRFAGWKSSSPFFGRLTYFTGSVTRCTTTYFWSEPASVTTLLGNKSGNWLVVSGSIQIEGIYWSRTINEKYNPNGWPAPIYP